MPRVPEKFVVLNLKQLYHEFGKYDFKIVLNERYFKNGHGVNFTLYDSAGVPIKHDLKVWGRKIVCEFEITPDVAEGVARSKFSLKTEKGDKLEGNIEFWIVN